MKRLREERHPVRISRWYLVRKKLESRDHEKKKIMGAGPREVNDVWRHDLVVSVEYTNDSRRPASHTPRHGIGRAYA